ncbi:MAG: DUF1015 domain-containing protein [Cyanobacteria bacterium P01_H01_bin.74]
MAKIFPFKGTRYNPIQLEAAGYTLSDAVAPPYDVIDSNLQQALMKQCPANFVHVDLNPATPKDNTQNNPYTRADHIFQSWENTGMVQHEAAPAIYAYSQSWEDLDSETGNKKTVERKGAVALLALEPFETGTILPHEHTLKGPKLDRLNLMRSTETNLSQIFMLYSDPDQLLETLFYSSQTETGQSEQDAWQEVFDADNVCHRFKPVTDSKSIAALQAMLQEKSLLIADGHHRFETALAFQQEVREQIQEKTGKQPEPGSLLSDYCMVFLTNMDNPGLKVYPTHRVLYRWPEGFDEAQFEEKLAASFSAVGQFSPVKQNEQAGQPAIVFAYRSQSSKTQTAYTLKEGIKPDALPDLLNTFDAALLEELVFKGLFKKTGEVLKHEKFLGFYRDEQAIETLLENKEAVAVFYLAAPSIKLIAAICQNGHRMPQKSTYFYPKILSGLVTYLYRQFEAGDNTHALHSVVDSVCPVSLKSAESPALI